MYIIHRVLCLSACEYAIIMCAKNTRLHYTVTKAINEIEVYWKSAGPVGHKVA